MNPMLRHAAVQCGESTFQDVAVQCDAATLSECTTIAQELDYPYCSTSESESDIIELIILCKRVSCTVYTP